MVAAGHAVGRAPRPGERTARPRDPRRRPAALEGARAAAWRPGRGPRHLHVRVPPSGTWERRRADLVAASEDWIGREEVDLDAARDLIVRRYLAAFGPARRQEIADWAGMNTSDVAPALERLKLRHFRDPAGADLVDLPRAPLPDPETPAPPRFLPTWDATLLVHARRTQILPEEYRPRIFGTKTPNSFNTFLVDGQVAGTWRHDGGRIALKPFHRLDARDRRELEEEAERLAAFHAR